ncbi:MAG TPA: class I SAM-dependent methyltransferase [Candidatus Binataceae bacterium]|nr:class I SAM-dependent methyltransferase [Candidatus Binataceae bacterium]
MTTDYNHGHVAEQYRKAKEQPWRSRIETYSLMKLIGDLKGKKVLDAACGEGHFTRILRRAGAAKAAGFDVSARMIDLAREQEAKDRLGIEYTVEDARSIVPQQDFDLVAAAWLLVYAHDRAELARMCRGMASRLRSGGRFVTFTTNPGVYEFKQPPDYLKYGFEMKLADHVFEGAPILFTTHLGDERLKIENYFLPIEAYESAFRDAGFRDFKVHMPELSPAPDGSDDRDYWNDFIDYPIAILMESVRI